MTNTDQGLFTIHFLDDKDVPINVIEAADKQYYICAERGQAFYIEINRRNKHEMVGSKLFLDGKELPGTKTLKYKSHYYGFKMGDGQYKKFIFDLPPLKDSKKSKEEIEEENRQFGTIKVVFYETIRVESKRKFKKFSNYQPYHQSIAEEGKKFFERALSVREGEIFKVLNKFPEVNNREGQDDYFVDYTKAIDEVSFVYTDFIALELKGIVSINNIAHLNFIPSNLLKENPEYVACCLKTILKLNINLPVHYVDLMSLFEKYTFRKIDSFIEDTSQFLSFLQNRITVFAVDSNGKITLTLIKQFENKLWNMPVHPEQKYLQKIGVNNFSGASNSTNFTGAKNGDSMMMDPVAKIKDKYSEIEVIVLDDEDEQVKADEENQMEWEI